MLCKSVAAREVPLNKSTGVVRVQCKIQNWGDAALYLNGSGHGTVWILVLAIEMSLIGSTDVHTLVRYVCRRCVSKMRAGCACAASTLLLLICQKYGLLV